MIDLALKLIDKLIDLGKRREEQNKNYYNNFVAPAFADFEIVYNGYLTSCRRYINLIRHPRYTLNNRHPIFKEISEDQLFSRGIKSKISLLYRDVHRKDDRLDAPLLLAMADFFNHADGKAKTVAESQYHYLADLFENDYKIAVLLGGSTVAEDIVKYFSQDHTFFGGLSNSLRIMIDAPISDAWKENLASSIIIEVVKAIEHKYQIVAQEHLKLKHKLLLSL